MIKKATLILAGLLSLTMLAHADASFENSGFKIETVIRPQATYSIQEFYNKFQSNQPFGDLGSIMITNKTAETAELVVRVAAYSNVLGSSSSPIIDAVTVPSKKPIVILPGGTFTFSPANDTSAIAKLHNMSQSEVEDRITAKYGANLLTDTAGLAPEGTYTYEIRLYNASDTSLSTPLAGPLVDSVTLPLEYGNIAIISPQDEAVLSDYPINFIWQGLNIRSGVNAHYIFRLWDQNPLSTGVAPRLIVGANSNLEKNNNLRNKTLFSYTSAANELLIPGKKYYWQVIAKDDLNLPIGLGEGSNIFSFRVTPQIEKASISLLGPSNDARLQKVNRIFSWQLNSSEKLDLTYTIYVKDDKGNIIFKESTKETKMDLSQFDWPVRTLFTWHVQASDEYGNTIQTEPNTIYTERFIKHSLSLELYSPANNSIVTSTPITFQWKDKGLDSKKVFILSDSSNTIIYVKNVTGANKLILTNPSILNSGERYKWAVVIEDLLSTIKVGEDFSLLAWAIAQTSTFTYKTTSLSSQLGFISLLNFYKDLLSTNGLDVNEWEIQSIKKNGTPISQNDYSNMLKEALKKDGKYYFKKNVKQMTLEDVK